MIKLNAWPWIINVYRSSTIVIAADVGRIVAVAVAVNIVIDIQIVVLWQTPHVCNINTCSFLNMPRELAVDHLGLRYDFRL